MKFVKISLTQAIFTCKSYNELVTGAGAGVVLVCVMKSVRFTLSHLWSNEHESIVVSLCTNEFHIKLTNDTNENAY